jgi:tellurite resistance protein TerC
VLLIVETTDVVFAVDSVPAVLSVVTSKDPFIIYTSNVFAILGLRSLYFALAGLMDYFHFLNYGLCLILVFVGSKMLASTYVHVPVELSLGVIAGVLVISIIASIIWPQRHKPDHPPHEILVDK